MAIFGTQVIEKWTAGVVHPPKYLLMLMVLATALNCFWLPLSNLILAVNKQSTYSYIFLIASILSVATTYPLSVKYGLNGAAISLIGLEIIMLLHVVRLLPKVVVNPHEIHQAVFSILNRLRVGVKYL